MEKQHPTNSRHSRNFDLEVKVLLEDENAKPIRRSDNNAGFDIWANLGKNEVIEIGPFETKVVKTGVRLIIPEGYYLQVHERSSTGSIGLKCSAGVIDQDYTGEIGIVLYNANGIPILINHSHDDFKTVGSVISYDANRAIAQLVPHKYYKKMTAKVIDEDEFAKLSGDSIRKEKNGFVNQL